MVDERVNVEKEGGGVWLVMCGCMDTTMDSTYLRWDFHYRLLLLHTFFLKLQRHKTYWQT